MQPHLSPSLMTVHELVGAVPGLEGGGDPGVHRVLPAGMGEQGEVGEAFGVAAGGSGLLRGGLGAVAGVGEVGQTGRGPEQRCEQQQLLLGGGEVRDQRVEEDVSAPQSHRVVDGVVDGPGVAEVDAFVVGQSAQLLGDREESGSGALAEQDVEELDQPGVAADGAGDQHSVIAGQLAQRG